jgi:hypothetical protein
LTEVSVFAGFPKNQLSIINFWISSPFPPCLPVDLQILEILNIIANPTNLCTYLIINY